MFKIGPRNYEPLRNDEFLWNNWYRARVTEVDIDENKFGAVRVFVPDLMDPDLDDDIDEMNDGLVAWPANNSMHGQNQVPLYKEWVWLFFEQGNPNRPYYSAVIDIEHTEFNSESKDIEHPHRNYQVAKTITGRSIIINDSPDEQRVEITGKRRNFSEYDVDTGVEEDSDRPEDDYKQIDGNQTVILLDEREGKEKILMRSHKGDFIHFDIDQRKLQIHMKDDIHIETGNKLYVTAANGIDLLTKRGNFNCQASGGNFNAKSAVSSNIDGGSSANVRSGGVTSVSGGVTQIGGSVLMGSGQHSTGGAGCGPHSHPVPGYTLGAGPASPAGPATIAMPRGKRDE